MAAYATVQDVQARMTETMSSSEQTMCGTLLDDAAVMIDALAPDASSDAKKIVSCRMVIRAIEDPGDGVSLPIGASQGSMAAGGYSQSWTISGGSTGELYIGKAERALLGVGNRIGSYSPVQEMAVIPCD